MNKFRFSSDRTLRAACAINLSLAVALSLFQARSASAQRGQVHQNPSIQKGRVTAMAAPTDIGARVYWFAIPTTGYGTAPISMIAPTAAGVQVVMPTGAPWVPTINTVADILARCIDIASTCPTLFAATTPPGIAAPINTFQAAVYIAMNPNLNLSSLFSQITAADPFQPVLPSLPASWTLRKLQRRLAERNQHGRGPGGHASSNQELE